MGHSQSPVRRRKGLASTVGPQRGDGAMNGGCLNPRKAGMPRERMPAHRLFNSAPDDEELPRRRSHKFH